MRSTVPTISRPPAIMRGPGVSPNSSHAARMAYTGSRLMITAARRALSAARLLTYRL